MPKNNWERRAELANKRREDARMAKAAGKETRGRAKQILGLIKKHASNAAPVHVWYEVVHTCGVGEEQATPSKRSKKDSAKGSNRKKNTPSKKDVFNDFSAGICRTFFLAGEMCKDRKCPFYHDYNSPAVLPPLSDFIRNRTRSRGNSGLVLPGEGSLALPPLAYECVSEAPSKAAASVRYVVIDGSLAYDFEKPDSIDAYEEMKMEAAPAENAPVVPVASSLPKSGEDEASLINVPETLIARILAFAHASTAGVLAATCKNLCAVTVSPDVVEILSKFRNWYLGSTDQPVSVAYSTKRLAAFKRLGVLTGSLRRVLCKFREVPPLSTKREEEGDENDTEVVDENIIPCIKTYGGFFITGTKVTGMYQVSKGKQVVAACRAIVKKKAMRFISFDLTNQSPYRETSSAPNNDYIYSLSCSDASEPLKSVFISALSVDNLLCGIGVDEPGAVDTCNLYGVLRAAYGYNTPSVLNIPHRAHPYPGKMMVGYGPAPAPGLFLGVRAGGWRLKKKGGSSGQICCCGEDGHLAVSFFAYWLAPCMSIEMEDDEVVSVVCTVETVLLKHFPRVEEGGGDWEFVQTLFRTTIDRGVPSGRGAALAYHVTNFRVPDALPIWARKLGFFQVEAGQDPECAEAQEVFVASLDFSNLKLVADMEDEMKLMRDQVNTLEKKINLDTRKSVIDSPATIFDKIQGRIIVAQTQKKDIITVMRNGAPEDKYPVFFVYEKIQFKKGNEAERMSLVSTVAEVGDSPVINLKFSDYDPFARKAHSVYRLVYTDKCGDEHSLIALPSYLSVENMSVVTPPNRVYRKESSEDFFAVSNRIYSGKYLTGLVFDPFGHFVIRPVCRVLRRENSVTLFETGDFSKAETLISHMIHSLSAGVIDEIEFNHRLDETVEALGLIPPGENLCTKYFGFEIFHIDGTFIDTVEEEVTDCSFGLPKFSKFVPILKNHTANVALGLERKKRTAVLGYTFYHSFPGTFGGRTEGMYFGERDSENKDREKKKKKGKPGVKMRKETAKKQKMVSRTSNRK